MDATLKGTGSRSLVGNSAAVGTVSTAVFSSAGRFSDRDLVPGVGIEPTRPFRDSGF